ncbi:hypothetical protein NKH48_03225 [Mesorhizobium sp. M1233]|uniref:hypothetical protein n=1 Tax=Mesorhizobium sp. M1233 TaxID=2957072 RepID=UPI003334DC9F
MTTETVKKTDDGMMFVLDMTATPSGGPREHDMLVEGVVRTIKFVPGKPNKMPREIAVKFLKISTAFKLTDANGTVLPWRGVPKQPDELQAGEKLKLAPDETIANFHDLHDQALWLRAVEFPGGEKVAESGDREAMIALIVTALAERKKINSVNEANPDEWTPPADDEDAA